MSCPSDTGSSSPAASVTTSATSTGSCRVIRPASARASSSRSATSRRIRRDERSAEAAASRCSPVRTSSSSSRFASTEVSGVRSSCDASATNSRWRTRVASVSERAPSSAWSIPSSVRASSATSSSASGCGIRREGSRVRSIVRAVSVSSAIGVIARRAVATPASSASIVPPTTPSPRKKRTRLAVASTSLRPPRVLHERHAAQRVHVHPPRLHAEPRELQRRRQRRREIGRVGRGLDDRVVLGHDPHHRVLRARVRAQVRPGVLQRPVASRCARRRGRWSASPAGRRPRPPAG